MKVLFSTIFLIGCGPLFTVQNPNPQPEPEAEESPEVGDEDDYAPASPDTAPKSPTKVSDQPAADSAPDNYHPVKQNKGVSSPEKLLSEMNLSEDALKYVPSATFASYENSLFQQDYGRTLVNRIRYIEGDRFSVFLLRQAANPTEPDVDNWTLYALVIDSQAKGGSAGSFYTLERTDNPDRFKPVAGKDCDTCHTSGARTLRPGDPGDVPSEVFATRPGAALNSDMIKYLNGKVLEAGRFPINKDNIAEGDDTPLKMKECTSCHSQKATRGPLTRKNGFSIMALVDANVNSYGYVESGHGGAAPMPPGKRLTRWQIQCLRDWVDGSDRDCD